ncbi:hypothetical protein Mpet_0025 [Methanolacinia petrolearia DSM 11571]|uniref:Uncharacterized protein n=1 Tax=Methanolacinia petrolearia (strain DSM 11571 / OCM 486 / SEBR 4847) TaxID=679926 RepID=E1RDC2_METP4|nr:hypothetical protein Mpet_0025 [Methanolacinia petrolearia DSM 11571]
MKIMLLHAQEVFSLGDPTLAKGGGITVRKCELQILRAMSISFFTLFHGCAGCSWQLPVRVSPETAAGGALSKVDCPETLKPAAFR